MLIIYVNAVSNGLKLPHLNSVWPDRVISATIFEWTECDLNKHATTDEYYYTVVIYTVKRWQCETWTCRKVQIPHCFLNGELKTLRNHNHLFDRYYLRPKFNAYYGTVKPKPMRMMLGEISFILENMNKMDLFEFKNVFIGYNLTGGSR